MSHAESKTITPDPLAGRRDMRKLIGFNSTSLDGYFAGAGRGRTMFEGVRKQLSLRLTKTRAFVNGNVLLCYEPSAG